MNILEVISCLGPMTKYDFQEVIRHFHPHTDGYVRNCIQRDLEALGHIHTDHEQGKVFVLSPKMCVLPTRDKRVARVVIFGARPNQDDFIEELRGLSPCTQGNIKVKSEVSFPWKIELSGDSDRFFDRLNAIAENHSLFRTEKDAQGSNSPLWHLMGDPSGTPGAWVALHSAIGSSSTESLQSRLQTFFRDGNHQQLGDAGSWRVFNPLTQNWALWSQIRNQYDRNILLIQKEKYKYMLAKKNGESWELYLNKFSHDPLWAKWAVLQNRDGEADFLPRIEDWKFLISHGLPLPIELHRVCCLCSGLLPEIIPGGEGIRYSNIPPVIQKHIIDKLIIA